MIVYLFSNPNNFKFRLVQVSYIASFQNTSLSNSLIICETSLASHYKQGPKGGEGSISILTKSHSTSGSLTHILIPVSIVFWPLNPTPNPFYQPFVPAIPRSHFTPLGPSTKVLPVATNIMYFPISVM